MNLESECRKLRASNNKLLSENEEIQSKYEEKREEVDILQQTNNTYSKKIENLIT